MRLSTTCMAPTNAAEATEENKTHNATHSAQYVKQGEREQTYKELVVSSLERGS